MPDPLINIFISYSHRDSDFVDRLEVDLRAQGFGTWMDRQRLAGGQRFQPRGRGGGQDHAAAGGAALPQNSGAVPAR